MEFKVEAGDNAPRLEHAVLLYRSGSFHYATKHAVSEKKGVPTIRPGRRMTEEDLRILVHALEPQKKAETGWVDERLLATSNDYTIWWTPAQERSMFFKASDMYGGTFTGSNVCPNPALVWMKRANRLYVYAVKDDGRPTQDTILHQAPFFNVWARGEVCHGSAKAPSADQGDERKGWEDFFFKSNFTHPNFRDKGRLIKGADPVEFWKKQVEKPSRAFPKSALAPLKFTVKDLMDEKRFGELKQLKAKGEF